MALFRIDLPELEPALLIAKTIGAVAGSLVSIAYILPRGRREAWLRFAVGLVCGLVFGTVSGLKIAETLAILDQLSIIEVSLIGSTIASLCAWWGLGVLHRLSEVAPSYLDGWIKLKKPQPSKKGTKT